MNDPSIISIVSQFDVRLAALLGWVVVLVKVLVDWLKTATTLPHWAPPGLAFATAWALIVVLMVALAIPLSAQLIAQAIICALVAAVLAVGSTALQARTKPNDMTVTTIVDELERRRDERVKARLQAAGQQVPSQSVPDQIIGLIDKAEGRG